MALTTQQIQSAYVTFFSRPADVGGLNYWADYKGSEADLYTTFAQSKEYADLFEGKSNSQKVAAVYQNLFGRPPEAEGLNYWTLQLDKGAVTVASLALAVAGGAQGTDAETLANRVSAATTFTQSLDTGAEILAYQGNEANAVAKQWLSAVTDDASLAAAVTEANLAAVVAQMGGDSSQSQQLTNGTDKLVGNKFEAAQVYTPGGNDRINSLQNDDELTGTGANPTLNVTLGNENDNGTAEITPTLKGIETINASFDSTKSPMSLDLQDSTGVKVINVKRIADGKSATVKNIADAVTELSVSNSNAPQSDVNFTFLGSAVKGTADAVALKLSNVDVNKLVVEERNNGAEGFETINLTSTGAANAVKTLQAEDLQALNIAGDKDLTLGGKGQIKNDTLVEAVSYTTGLVNVAGSLKSIDASAFEGKLDITLSTEFQAGLDGTSGKSVELSVTGGKGDDTIRLVGSTVAGAVGNTDKIDGGEGTNTLVLTGGATIAAAGTAAAPVANVTNIQKLEVRANVAPGTEPIKVDANAFDKLASIYVRNEGNAASAPAIRPATVELNNLTTAQAADLTVAHGTSGNNGLEQLTVKASLKTATGTNDTVAVNIVDGVNKDARFNFKLDTNAPGTNNANVVENITLNDKDTESNTVQLLSKAITNGVEASAHTGTVTLTGGAAGQYLSLDASGNVLGRATDGGETSIFGATSKQTVKDIGTSDAERLVAKTIDAATYAGDVIVRLANGNVSDATGAQKVTTGAGDDWIVFDALNHATAGLSISDTVDGGAGKDTLAIDGHGTKITISASEWTNVKNIETIHLVGNAQGSDNVLGNSNAYNLTLTNDFINNNGVETAGVRLINIVNDNDNSNSAKSGEFVASGNTGVTIDARSLAANRNFTYNGQEGAGTKDRFIMADANVNGVAVIDGGAADDAGNVNEDVLEIRNAAVVTIGDLVGISNVGKLQFTNDSAVTQTSTLVLDSTTVDRLVNSQHAAKTSKIEELKIEAIGNRLAGGSVVVNTALDLDATQVSNLFKLVIDTTQANSGAANNAGDDTIRLKTNGASTKLTLGREGGDKLLFSGEANKLVVTADSLQFENDSGTVLSKHEVTLSSVLDLSGVKDLTSVSITGGSGNDTLFGTTAADSITGGAGDDTITGGAGNDTFNVTAGTDTITDLATGDILVVSAGATAIANNVSAFTATAATSNAGTATLNAVAAGGNINVAAATGAFTLNGGAGADTLVGGAGDDAINGGEGADIITGGAGNDTIVLTETAAAAAADVVVFGATAAANGVDTITGFAAGTTATADKLQVSAFTGAITAANVVIAQVAAAAAGTDLSGKQVVTLAATVADAAALSGLLATTTTATKFTVGATQKMLVIADTDTDATNGVQMYFVDGVAATLVGTVTAAGTWDAANFA